MTLVEKPILANYNGDMDAWESDFASWQAQMIKGLNVKNEIVNASLELSEAMRKGANERIDELESSESKLIGERAHWESKSTELAEDIGSALGFDVGEHSSDNCPVQNAIDGVYEMRSTLNGVEAKERRIEELKEALNTISCMEEEEGRFSSDDSLAEIFNLIRELNTQDTSG